MWSLSFVACAGSEAVNYITNTSSSKPYSKAVDRDQNGLDFFIPNLPPARRYQGRAVGPRNQSLITNRTQRRECIVILPVGRAP